MKLYLLFEGLKQDLLSLRSELSRAANNVVDKYREIRIEEIKSALISILMFNIVGLEVLSQSQNDISVLVSSDYDDDVFRISIPKDVYEPDLVGFDDERKMVEFTEEDIKISPIEDVDAKNIL